MSDHPPVFVLPGCMPEVFVHLDFCASGLLCLKFCTPWFWRFRTVMPDVFLHGSFYIFLYSDLFIFENIDLLPSICYPHFRRIPLFTVLVPDTSPRTYSPNESPPRTYSPNELFPREIRTRVYKNSTVAHIFTDFTGYQVP
jgi:hypothetical protein